MMYRVSDSQSDLTEEDSLLETYLDPQVGEDGDRELLRLDLCGGGDDELLTLEKELEAEDEGDGNRGCVQRALDRVSIFLVRLPHPCVPGSLLLLVGLLGLFVGVGYACYQHHPPQEVIDAIQDDATLGFETRGTYIRRGQATADQLFNELIGNKPSRYSGIPNRTLALKQLGAPDTILQYLNSPPPEDSQPPSSENVTLQESDKVIYCDILYCDEKQRQDGSYSPMAAPDLYFVFVVGSSSGQSDLYTAERMRDVCRMEREQILPLLDYRQNCQMCGLPVSRSLPTIIASYLQKDCQELTSNDLQMFRSFFKRCLKFLEPPQDRFEDTGDSFVNLVINGPVTTTTSKSEPSSTSAIPDDCLLWKDMILDIREFLVDKSFSSVSGADKPLTYVPVFVQAGNFSQDALQFYRSKIEKKSLRSQDTDIQVQAFGVRDESLKWDLFQEYFLSDTLWFGLSMGLVFVTMLLYLRRIDLVVATILSVGFGFVFAYAIYYFILKMKFFPFINLLALLVLIAVGADDVFVFFDIYQQTKAAYPEMTLEKVISRTLSHAALSVFVTSLTTAAAFFANAVSNITAIKVFGIFAGIAILVNFVVMLLVVPSIIILVEKLLGLIRRNLRPEVVRVLFCKCKQSRGIAFLRRVFDEYFPRLIDRTWWLWLLLLSILSILAAVAVFAYPKFQLPDTKDFQLFPTSNLLENWFFNVKKNFYFVEREERTPMVTASYVFGFKAIDGGNHWNPYNKTTHLIEDEDFNFYAPEVQKWLSKFCEDQIAAEYVPDRVHDYTCNFEAYEKTIEAVCEQISPQMVLFLPGIQECCATKSAPYNDTQLQQCIPVYMAIIFDKLPPVLHIPRPTLGPQLIGTPIFDESTNRVKGYLLYIATKWPYTFNYDEMQVYYNTLAGDFIERLKTAPKGVQRGFVGFNRDFYFYDLQHSLATGAYFSVGLSLAVAFLVMLCTSLNVLITVYAMATITLAIVCTIAAIVLMGWHLNVIEAVIISLSVGLSIDFTIHYGVAYRLSETDTSQLRVRDSFRKVGGAVAMAALTTFLSGAGLMPCHVLPYLKLGIFLMLVMVFAWLYANFFFQSLCRILGPRGNFCQISALCSKGNKKRPVARDPDRMSLNSVDSDDSLLVTF